MAQIITHLGTVGSIDGKHIRVCILQASACSSCVAKKLCTSSESKEKWIDIQTDSASEYQVGEKVMLTGSLRMGFQAVVWAYVIPLILLLLVLGGILHFTADEPFAALCALGSLVAYYAMLYLFRSKLSKKFSFKIKHLN